MVTREQTAGKKSFFPIRDYTQYLYTGTHMFCMEPEVPFIPRIMTEHAHGKTGIDINPGARIGEYFLLTMAPEL